MNDKDNKGRKLLGASVGGTGLILGAKKYRRIVDAGDAKAGAISLGKRVDRIKGLNNKQVSDISKGIRSGASRKALIAGAKIAVPALALGALIHSGRTKQAMPSNFAQRFLQAKGMKTMERAAKKHQAKLNEPTWAKELKRELKLKRKPDPDRYDYNYGPVGYKTAKANTLKTFDDTLSKLISMSKSDPDRVKLMKKIDTMAPEVMSKNPKATRTFLQMRHNLIKTSKAESKSQQRLMGMVHAYQNGTLENFSELPSGLQKKIKDMAMSMSSKQTKDYAETKHKGLKEKKKS